MQGYCPCLSEQLTDPMLLGTWGSQTGGQMDYVDENKSHAMQLQEDTDRIFPGAARINRPLTTIVENTPSKIFS